MWSSFDLGVKCLLMSLKSDIPIDLQKTHVEFALEVPLRKLRGLGGKLGDALCTQFQISKCGEVEGMPVIFCHLLSSAFFAIILTYFPSTAAFFRG